MPAAAPDCIDLAEGVRLHLHALPAGEPAALALAFACGSHDEPAQWLGMAHFMEHLVFRGSRRFAAADSLMPHVQAAGGRVNARTSARQTLFHFEVTATAFLAAAERLVDMLQAPEFAADSLASEREVLHQEHGMYSRMPLAHFQASGGALLQGSHPLQKFYAGHRDSLTLEDSGFADALRQYHQLACRQSPLEIAAALPQDFALEPLLACLQPLLAERRSRHQLPPPALQLATGVQGCLRVPGSGGGWLLHLALNRQGEGLAQLAQQLNQALAGLPDAGAGWQCLPCEPFDGQGLFSLWLPGATGEGPRQTVAHLLGWLHSWQAYLQQPVVQALEQQAADYGRQLAEPLEKVMQRVGAVPAMDISPAMLASLAEVCRLLAGGDFALLEVRDEAGEVTFDQGLPLALTRLPPQPLLLQAAKPVTVWPHPLAQWLQPGPSHSDGLLSVTRQWPAQWPDHRAWLYWGWHQQVGAQQLQQLDAQLATLANSWRRHAVSWQLEARAGLLLLKLEGPSDCLGAALNSVLAALADTELFPDSGQLPAPPPGGFALRRLMAMLPAFWLASGPLPGLKLAERPQSALWLGNDRDLARLSERWRSALQHPVTATVSATPALPVRQRWQDVGGYFAGTDETLLVAWCPAADALQAALWRCLAPLLELLLQQRLRSEQGLCYAVFARPAQPAGQPGLVLAMQSSGPAAGPLVQALQAAVSASLHQLQQQPEALLLAWAQWCEQVRQGRLPLAEQAERLLSDWLQQNEEAQPAGLPLLSPEQLPALLQPLCQPGHWYWLANVPQPDGLP